MANGTPVTLLELAVRSGGEVPDPHEANIYGIPSLATVRPVGCQPLFPSTCADLGVRGEERPRCGRTERAPG